MVRQTVATLTIFMVLGAMLVNRGLGQVVGIPPFNGYEAAREQLINEILIPGGVTDAAVLSAMRNTPRHEFVAQNQRAEAYFDRALPIGSSQTISSPYIVAIMTQELKVQPSTRCWKSEPAADIKRPCSVRS